MSRLLNIPLDILKPIILEQELKVFSEECKKSSIMSLSTIVRFTNDLIQQVYKIQTFEELEFFVMEGNDMTREEAKTYISGILFEQEFMYN